MIKKNVTYYEYQVLKAIYASIKVLKADDDRATVVVKKQHTRAEKRDWNKRNCKQKWA